MIKRTFYFALAPAAWCVFAACGADAVSASNDASDAGSVADITTFEAGAADASALDAGFDASPLDATASDADGGDAAPGCDIVPLATGQAVPYAVAVDATSVYWALIGGYTGTPVGGVAKVPINGGAVTPLASGTYTSSSIALDATHVYFTTAYQGTGTILQISKNGGATTPLVSGAFTVGGLVVEGDYLYWTKAGEATVMRTTISTANSVPLTGGAGYAYKLGLDSSNVFFTNQNGSSGEVVRVSKDGGATLALATGQGQLPQTLAVDALGVFWSTDSPLPYAIRTLGSDGGVVEMAPATDVGGIALDATNVYWTNRTGPGTEPNGSVMRLARSGGQPSVVACAQDSPQGITVDATHVYWVNRFGGQVMRSAK